MNSRPSDTGLLSVNANQLVAILLARRRVVIGVMLTTLFATALILFVRPHVWTASSDVYVDFKANNPLEGSTYSSLSPTSDDGYIQTQIDMIQSQAVIERMLAEQGLLPPLSADTNVDARNRLVQRVSANLRVAGGHGSRVLQVSFSDKSPDKARDGANAIVNAYLALSQQVSQSSARSVSEQYTAQLELLRREVNTIQSDLTNYRQQTGIVDQQPDNVENARRLRDMLTEQQTLQAQIREARARNETTSRMLASGVRPENLPYMATLSTLNDLHGSLDTVNRQISTVDGALGRNHPAVRGLLAERQRLQANIATVAQAALTGQRDDLVLLQTQESALANDIAQQRKLVLQQLDEHDRIAAYQRQIQGAEQVYNDALQKYGSVLMASRVTLPHMVVLHVAEAPVKPSSPKVGRALLAGLLVGLMGGVALALLLELRKRRVRCTDDLLRSPTLGMIGHIGRPSFAKT